jgi:hypothetical protein
MIIGHLILITTNIFMDLLPTDLNYENDPISLVSYTICQYFIFTMKSYHIEPDTMSEVPRSTPLHVKSHVNAWSGRATEYM